MAHLIQVLNDVTGVSTKLVHIIGHSLGAHIAGFAGKRLATNNHALGRISGTQRMGRALKILHNTVLT